jgi:uncharacterized protein
MEHTGELTRTKSFETPRVERFMLAVYAWMTVGLAVTAATAFHIAQSESALHMLTKNPLVFLAVFVAEVLLVTVIDRRVRQLSAFSAGAIFVLYALLNGITLSVVVNATTRTSLAQAFVAVSCMFLAMTTVGLCTKKSLDGWSTFLFMGLTGVVVASLLNLLLGSSGMQWVISLASVVVFSGLTAYDTQKLLDAAREGDGGARPVHGALLLYLDFINLVLALLNILGGSEEQA